MKTKLKWRLGKLPTSEEVLELVKASLITKEEAKEILFTQETEEDIDAEALKSEIKFLRNLIEKLSNRTQIVEVIKEVHKPYYKYDWYRPYQYWSSNDGVYLCNAGATALNDQALVGSGTINAMCSVDNSALNTSAAISNFSDIKTF